jgi:hypothetical protein
VKMCYDGVLTVSPTQGWANKNGKKVKGGSFQPHLTVASCGVES